MDVLDQTRIWNYFQGEASDSFAGAATRLKWLSDEASQLTGKRTLSVLNIGVGDGFLERKCASKGWEVYALDPSPVAIERLQRYGITAAVGCIEHLPYEQGKFDVVFCSEVFEHLTPDQLIAGLVEIRRVLKGDGLLIGTVPFEERMSNNRTVCPSCGCVFHRWGHHQSFTASRMKALLCEARFSVLYARPKVFVSFRQDTFQDLAIQIARWIAGKLIYRKMSCNLCVAARKYSPERP